MMRNQRDREFAWRIILLVAAFVTLTPIASGQTSQAAEMIVLHGRIYTLDAKRPWAQAAAIASGKIIAVGDDSEIEKLRGDKTQIIDAANHLVLPGFTDCHVHFISGALSLQRAQLSGVKNVLEVQQRLRGYSAQHPGNGWILGRGWNYAIFGRETLPDKRSLDELFPDRPVFLVGYDGHTGWANSKALALAGITNDTTNPPNGIIVRDPKTHEATGALKESAQRLVTAVIPKPTRDENLAALRGGMKWANEHGLTRVHSAGGDFELLDLYDELRRQGQQTLRFYISYFLNPPELRAQDLQAIEGARMKFHDDWIDTDVVKMMVDGVIESHTAAMLEPYTDDPSTRGKLFWDPAKYFAAVAELDKRGLQLFTHAIGDYGIRTALDAYEHAEQSNSSRDRRPRIEHIESASASDIPRFGKLGVIASMQPLHSYPDDDTLNVWARNIGPERASRAWVWKSIGDSGGRLAFGSDWPVVTLNPWEGIQTAVTRQTSDGKPEGGFVPGQRLTVEQALRGYTIDAAYAGRCEKTEGSIEAGKLADLIVVSQNVFEVDLKRIRDTKVLTTIVGGRVVYRAPN